MRHGGIIASFGSSSAFAGLGFWEWITSPSAGSAIAVLGSTISTLIGWYFARRDQVARGRADQAATERMQNVLDALAAAAIKQAEAGDIGPALKLIHPEPEARLEVQPQPDRT